MQTKNKKSNRIKTRVVFVLVFIVLVAIYAFISYRGNYLETIEIGENLKQVLNQNLKYQIITIAINFIILFAIILIVNRSIKKTLKFFFDEDKKEMPKLPNKSIAFIISLVVSIIASYFLREQIAVFANKAWFGANDPVFGLDLGFYIFELPSVENIVMYFIITIIGLAIYMAIYYIAVFNIYFDGINSKTLAKSNFFKQITWIAMTLAARNCSICAYFNTRNDK